MGRAVLVVVCIAGCGFNAHLGGDSPTGDGPPITGDASADARMLDGCTTFSTVVNSCAVGTYGGKLTITNSRIYNTETHMLADVGGGSASMPNYFDTMINGNPITLLVIDGLDIQQPNGKLRVVGTRAFGVVSTAAISIAGTLDATAGGAGARLATTCMSSAGQPGTNCTAASGGGSGGGGGGYGSTGGKGGKGDNNGTNPLNGGNGGAMTNLAHTIIGGCPGGKGGNDGASGGQGGLGGPGGGAVFLTSANSIVVSGIINAGGGGGSKGNAIDGAGGGGGSGGMILLESTIVMHSGVLAANGGSGGGGSGNSSGTDGNNGLPAITAATGGIGGGAGTTGGAGGAQAQPGGLQPQDAGGGGGGGGGSVGYISIICPTPQISGFISPTRTAFP